MAYNKTFNPGTEILTNSITVNISLNKYLFNKKHILSLMQTKPTISYIIAYDVYIIQNKLCWYFFEYLFH